MKNKQYPASIAPEMDPQDKRQKKWKKERKDCGFDETELWNLDITFGCLMLPRIKEYVRIRSAQLPSQPEYKQMNKNWRRDMTMIIKCLELLSTNDCWYKPEEEKIINRGLIAFIRNIRGMWL